MRKKTKFIACTVSAFLLWSCSPARHILQDGYYNAEIAEFDIFGWKEYVTIRVSGGRIIFVEYNAFNPSGFVKSWDMNYMRIMNDTDGTYPNAYTREYVRQFLESQGTEGVDMISGATHSYYLFIRLAEAVLESARQGNTQTVLVTLNSS